MSEHQDLERVFRAGLHQVAEGMGVSVPVAERARASVQRRRRGRVAIAVAVASVAAVSVVGVLASRDNSEPKTDPPAADQSPDSTEVVTEWRTEYWHGVQVDVPADWGWGSSPQVSAGQAFVCGGPVDEPYVGRPIGLSDLCTDIEGPPLAPYVWFDPEVPPGVVEVGGGYTRETVELGGSRVSVATDDAGLRSRIIGSLRESAFCPSTHRMVPEGRLETTIEGLGQLKETRVCAYSDWGGAGYELVAASRLPLRDFSRMEEALREAPPDPKLCKHVPEFVVATGWYADPYSEDRELWLRNDRVFELSCGVADLGTLEWMSTIGRVRATPEALDAWRGELYEATLHHFIGPQG